MDKTDSLLRAVIETDKCSDEEIEVMRNNTDMMEDYGALLTLFGAMRPDTSVDKEKEWQEIVAKADMHRKARLKKSFARKLATAAASTVAIACVAGGIAVGVSMHKTEKNETVTLPQTAMNGVAEDSTPQSMAAEEESINADVDNIVTFRDENLEQIAKVMSEHYGVETVFLNPDAKQLRLYLRWDKDMTIQQVAQTLDNIEQITVSFSDNKLTIQ